MTNLVGSAPTGIETLRREREVAERKLGLIRKKQADLKEWDRSRRPIRIGFLVVIPIVLTIEAFHLYAALSSTQGSSRAPWIMILALLFVTGVSFWYYRQARSQRDRVFRGFDRAAAVAQELEKRLLEIAREEMRLRDGPTEPLI